MKKIALIIFGIIAVAIALFVVLIVTQPPVKMTIKAIRPTGKIVTHTNANGEILTVQSWEFGITNVGRTPAHWIADVQPQRVVVLDGSYHPEPDILYDGMLMPGDGIVTNMITPVGDKAEWSVSISYFPQPTAFQRHLWNLGLKTPGLKDRLLRNIRGDATQTPWYTVTNAPTASSTVTNTP